MGFITCPCQGGPGPVRVQLQLQHITINNARPSHPKHTSRPQYPALTHLMALALSGYSLERSWLMKSVSSPATSTPVYRQQANISWRQGKDGS
jgi:hypothetical protein